MRLHVVGLPHAHTTAEYATCAYTQKIRKFGKMMTARGHEVVLYSGEENDTVCAEHVPIFTEQERAGWFGPHDLDAMHPDVWDASGLWWELTNKRAATAINLNRESEREPVLLAGGLCQAPIAEEVGHGVCEPFVGYEGIFSNYRAFESSAWMHHVYGLRQERYPSFMDEVIPNYFDPDEFPVCRSAPGQGDYLLFIGRVTERKGPQVAAEIADYLDLPLLVAGPGGKQYGRMIHGEGVRFRGEYLGSVGIADRAALYGQARCTLVPTFYLEPFGGVAVESMLTGTPVLATDFGAFRETVSPVTGRRFHTLQEALDGFEECDQIDPRAVRAEAMQKYSLRAVAPQFERWLERIERTWDDGYYALSEKPVLEGHD